MKPRLESLLEAQERAQVLFDHIAADGLISAGRPESAINRDIFALAKERLGINKFWHKRIVRAGPNTVLPYADNPPDYTVQSDDIAFVDLGPVFGDWEADFGRTYVVGNNPEKHALAQALPRVFDACRARYRTQPNMTGAQLYRVVVEALAQAGYRHENSHAGHTIGFFPHEKRIGDGKENYICPENDAPLNAPSADGEPRHWILEVHAVHKSRAFGGFVEELLA